MKLFFLSFFFLSQCVSGFAATTRIAPKSYTKGADLLAHKNYEAAQQKFLDSIRQSPGFIAAYIDYARAALLLKKRKDGLNKLEQALLLGVRKDERMHLQEERSSLAEIFFTNQTFQQYQNGLNFLQLERASAAIENFERALQTEPDNVAILTAYGEALIKDNNVSAGIKAYEQALALNPDKRAARLGLAEALGVSQAKRMQSLLEPIALDPDVSERAALLYAKALVGLSKEKDAYEYLRIRAERNSDWVESLFWLGKNYSQNKEAAWLARKYLMMFLKREREHSGLPANIRDEARALLARVNDSLN